MSAGLPGLRGSRARLARTARREEERVRGRTAQAVPGKAILVRAAPEVVRWLQDHNDEVIASLARRGAPRVSFEAHDCYAREGFDVATVA